MKLKIRKKKNKAVKIKDSECLNCGHPFFGHEKFCPECGQANKGSKITFGSFIREIFNGFFNFEAKFWNTIIPLLISPGKVSRDYIDGKRQRYSNPFRFYLTVSIIFFLIIGLFKSVQNLEELTKETETNISAKAQKNITNNTKKLSEAELDSLKKNLDNKMKNFVIPVPEKARKKVLDEVEKKAKDSIDTNKTKNDNFTVNFGNNTKLDKFLAFIDKYPETKIDIALDSLNYEKNFTNRFLYTRAKSIYSFSKSEETREQKFNQILSYGSIVLFILLPIFTLSLKFFYIRRKFTYVDHLIFVFHVQTVFFMLFSFYFIFRIFKVKPDIWVFIGLFLLYLFIAMKKFYKQGYFKTFFKFIFLNLSYGFVASIGTLLLFTIAFMFL